MRVTLCWVLLAFVFAIDVAAADFGTNGGAEPANIDEIADVLRQDPYDMELLISYGTSKGGSAGHPGAGHPPIWRQPRSPPGVLSQTAKTYVGTSRSGGRERRSGTPSTAPKRTACVRAPRFSDDARPR